jgi:hypothetical protein
MHACLLYIYIYIYRARMGAGQSNIQYEPPISFDVKFPGKNVIYDVHAMNIFDRAEFIMEDLGELDRHANGQVELWVRVAEGYVPSPGKLEALTRLFSGNKGAQSNPTSNPTYSEKPPLPSSIR